MKDLDLRLPSGAFFLLLGVILLGVGLTGDARAPLTTVNINLYCGIGMFVFGGILLWLAKR